ncbi:cytochrome P450 [Winogradskya humida]|uniref:Cytochrome P450 n=1 Tax=Winogradskya humida TaxID=113566 RepID=A0ABQ4A5P4_9ACTN|nr:cytochrome P450 [Actinoplanes humidus]GIE26159.1 cytochrome P450 [Actinoplanes humidus]
METLFDPRDPTMRADPYPHYHRLRAAEPIHRTPFGYWVLSRHEEVEQLVRSPHVSSAFHQDPSWVKHRGGAGGPAVGSTRHWMLMLDGAAHRRIRGQVNAAFTAGAVERLRPRIVELVKELLDELGDGEVDLIEGLALPLPVTVICELVGLPAEDRARCREWTDSIGRIVDPAITPEASAAMNRSAAEFTEYIREQLRLRRADPREDVLSLLAAADGNGDRLTDEEIIANVLLLFNAGHETTVNLIGNGVLALLRHPDQLQLLRDRPELMESAVDELARYDCPVQVAARVTTAEVRLGEATLPAGAKVMVLFGAASRDPVRYPDPDRLDITRSGTRTLAFGGGPHYCIGALLGKFETGLVLTELLRRYQKIELATDELVWRPNFNFRGLDSLPVKLVI